VLVGGSTRIPLVRRKVEELFGRTPHSELNPTRSSRSAPRCRPTS
jgi:molecular chaperone DnaK (HSP70)